MNTSKTADPSARERCNGHNGTYVCEQDFAHVGPHTFVMRMPTAKHPGGEWVCAEWHTTSGEMKFRRVIDSTVIAAAEKRVTR